MHSFGHRVESAMAHTFGRWDYNAIEKNDWELFATYDKIDPGNSHIGNIHYPPNALSDYDYKNPAPVVTHADNWARYPFLFQENRTVTCSEWMCSQLGYMSWWFHHLPHFTCLSRSGILNNWWSYIVDYNEGKNLEASNADCHCDYVQDITSVLHVSDRNSFRLYPNPSKGSALLTVKEMSTDNRSVEIFNHLGIKVREFVMQAGADTITLDLQKLTPGLYSVILNGPNQKGEMLQLCIIGY